MNTSIYNNTFLNSLFTAKEFKFIEDMDSDSQKYDSLLKVEIAYRDKIVTFINVLRDKMVKGENFEENESLDDLLKTSQECFDKVNENIKTIQGNKETSDNINKKIVDLLINIDSQIDNMPASKFYDQASNLKDEISAYTEKVESFKPTLEANDSSINAFLDKETVKKYLDSIINIEEEPVIEDEPSDVVKTISEDELNELSENIKEDNDTLLVSEKDSKVYLPYSKEEVLEYLEQYPKQYKSFSDVVNQEFIFPIDFYIKHPIIARFRETYALIRDRESKAIIDAFKMAMDTMFHHDLNPAIIAACKSQKQLEKYITCLEKKKLEEFNDFKIKFEVTPLKA
ncbi:MAG: hypothetical protein IKF17_05195 [Clostridia bacterium]|nr:hypothetical protein [Clostridia bacterium]